ncbi:class I SAM-dependent methyltransferase [Pelagicoccus mobilis]|uniref:Class I SAM-dependent methyltransferase n=1 Tax=Pelagicoccus mobilis TaxID=415221 RepID=A0A934VQJ6_9BACT|nr:class I SAM-dependent methyltransferase [Pelagicoccus mobilis]MBK1878422.1 class I SAM-dependent methyltransferase [Pelagicoccus mobilis]
MTRSFDRLARPYAFLERVSFGRSLEHARNCYISHLSNCPHGLLIGDGDGRFSSTLLQSNPNIKIDSLDISEAMLGQAQRRSGLNKSRFNPIHADATTYRYPTNNYDFLGLHFALDCFSQEQANELLPNLEQTLRPGGLIAYSDFQSTTFWQSIIVRCLYASFRVAANLRPQNLPSIVWSDQIQPLYTKTHLGGLLVSQLLQKR